MSESDYPITQMCPERDTVRVTWSENRTQELHVRGAVAWPRQIERGKEVARPEGAFVVGGVDLGTPYGGPLIGRVMVWVFWAPV